MDFDFYEERASRTAQYPGRGELTGLLYTALGLAGEAGETVDKVKKVLRDGGGQIDETRRQALQKELGDLLWYCSQFAHEIGTDLHTVAEVNLHKLANRKQRGTIGGSGDER